MQIGQSVAKVVAACCLVSVLCGGTCTVSTCKEHDCDPCTQHCHCSGTCSNPLAVDFVRAHTLPSYRLSVRVDPDGSVVRIYSEILGVSLDLYHGPGEHSTEDFARFARGVIDVNPVLAGPSGGWRADPVAEFETGVVVPFRGQTGSGTLSFLFDLRGNVVEIAEIRTPDPR